MHKLSSLIQQHQQKASLLPSRQKLIVSGHREAPGDFPSLDVHLAFATQGQAGDASPPPPWLRVTFPCLLSLAAAWPNWQGITRLISP